MDCAGQSRAETLECWWFSAESIPLPQSSIPMQRGRCPVVKCTLICISAFKHLGGGLFDFLLLIFLYIKVLVLLRDAAGLLR